MTTTDPRGRGPVPRAPGRTPGRSAGRLRPAAVVTALETPVRAAYAAIAAGDVDTLLDLLDPWVEWIATEGGPYGGTYVGVLDVLDGVLVPAAADWERLDVRPERFLATGATVAVVGTYDVTARGSGRSVRARFVHVWELDEGRAVRVELVSDSATLNAALR